MALRSRSISNSYDMLPYWPELEQDHSGDGLLTLYLGQAG